MTLYVAFKHECWMTHLLTMTLFILRISCEEIGEY